MSHWPCFVPPLALATLGAGPAAAATVSLLLGGVRQREQPFQAEDIGTGLAERSPVRRPAVPNANTAVRNTEVA